MSDSRALLYDRLVEESGQLGSSHRWLLAKVPRGSLVLDAGCAGGYLARPLIEDRGCVVDGIELEAESAARAARICRKVFTGSLDDSRFLGSLDGAYDRILFGDVLEHLQAPERTLNAMVDLLAPNGRILVSIPNVAYWSLRWELLRGRFEYQESGLMDCTHLRFYTYEGAPRMFEKAGLQVCERDYTLRIRGGRLGRQIADWYPNLFAYQSLFELKPIETPL